MTFLDNIIKSSGNQYASTVDDGLEGSDVSGYVDTGSYILNALVSGSLYKGIPNNKIIALAGESATGKTYFALGIVKKFLEDNPEGVVLYFDSEQAITSDMFIARGVDPKRIAVFPVSTVEEFRRQTVTIVDKCLEMKESERKPIFVVLDSLGMLSTEKEMNDTAEGKNVRDMTRAQVVKSTFRVLTIKLGVAKIPLLMTNHTYDVVGAYFPTKTMGGGCLVGGTKIRGEFGLVSIDDVLVGDKVWTKENELKSVLETHTFENKEILEITFEDGNIVKCTPEHKFLINGKWVEAKNLNEGVVVDVEKIQYKGYYKA